MEFICTPVEYEYSLRIILLPSVNFGGRVEEIRTTNVVVGDNDLGIATV